MKLERIQNFMSSIFWCEDSKSGYEFWKLMFQSINSDYIVESKSNNSELRKAAKKIDNDNNFYYLLVDQAMDNPEVVREVRALEQIIATKKNVSLVKVHSFEGNLLSFEHLENWLFDEVDEFREKRKELLRGKDLLVRTAIIGGEASDATELKKLMDKMGCRTNEQFAAKLLLEITRNTGFETGKGKLGDCFKNSCCEWLERQPDDKCGLDANRLTFSEKMNDIAKHSSITSELTRLGII